MKKAKEVSKPKRKLKKEYPLNFLLKCLESFSNGNLKSLSTKN